MSNEIAILVGTAITIGFIHTISGPDHYLPFIVLSKAKKWNMAKTAFVTFLCGCGHILSSVVLGIIGIIFGVAVFKLKAIESLRGELAAWLLIIFGFAYFIWGLHRALFWKPGRHYHAANAKHIQSHAHEYEGEHSHEQINKEKNLTPWVLFIIFVFGPCEPLIPLVMYPAAKQNLGAVVLVSFSFGLTTILTMLTIILTSTYGLSKLPLEKFERYSHALAGLAIFLCGGAIKLLGL